MSNDRIMFDDGTSANAVVAQNKPLPVAQQASSYLKLTNSALVKTGAGVIDRIIVGAAGTTITINVYDNTSGSGTVIFGPYVLAAGANINLGAAFTTGCYITFSGTTDTPNITALYR